MYILRFIPNSNLCSCSQLHSQDSGLLSKTKHSKVINIHRCAVAYVKWVGSLIAIPNGQVYTSEKPSPDLARHRMHAGCLYAKQNSPQRLKVLYSYRWPSVGSLFRDLWNLTGVVLCGSTEIFPFSGSWFALFNRSSRIYPHNFPFRKCYNSMKNL